jgi:hypothetical protein
MNSARYLGLEREPLVALLGSWAGPGRSLDNTARVRAGLLVFLSISLRNLFDDDREAIRSWMHSYCSDLRGTPRELVTSDEGLQRTAQFLDSFRRFPNHAAVRKS